MSSPNVTVYTDDERIVADARRMFRAKTAMYAAFTVFSFAVMVATIAAFAAPPSTPVVVEQRIHGGATALVLDYGGEHYVIDVKEGR